MQCEPPGPALRDLRAAVRSGWLSDAESSMLSEILDVLDRATAQTDAAGISLPMLSGLGVAIVDSYRAIAAGTHVR